MKTSLGMIWILVAACATSAVPSTTPTGFVYFSTDYAVTAVDVEARVVAEHRVPELAGGDPRYRFVRRGDLLVFYGQTEQFPEPAVFALDPDRLDRKPRMIAEAWFFVPSAQEDRVWLAILDPTSPATIRALQAVREVDTAGSITQLDIAPPEGRWPAGATDRGLLFQGDASLGLWDPHTQTMVSTSPGPFAVAVSKHRIATCGRPCDTLRLHDLEQGTERLVAPPDGIARINGYGGAFSPDGRYLAAVGFDDSGPFTEQTAVSLVLIDFGVATARTIPDTLTRPWDYPQVTWSASGDWLFFSNGPTLLAVEPAQAEAFEVDVELDGPYYGMAAR